MTGLARWQPALEAGGRHRHTGSELTLSMITRRKAVSGCLLAAALAGCNPPPEPLWIRLNPWPGYAYLYLAEELGYVREEGVGVRLVQFARPSNHVFDRSEVGLGKLRFLAAAPHEAGEAPAEALHVTLAPDAEAVQG